MSFVGLARMPLLADVPPDHLERLAAQCSWRRFDPGQVIVSRHAGVGDVHLVIDGRVRIHVCSEDGREVLFTQVQEGAIVGDFAAVDDGVRSTDAHAVTRVMTASLSAAAFRALLREHPKVEERYVRYLIGLVRQLTDRVIELSTLAVQNRIRTELLRQAHAEQGGGPARIEPAPRHADLAAQVGTTREQVTRELSALTRQGVLQKAAGALVVTDVQRLQALARSAGERGVRVPTPGDSDFSPLPPASRTPSRGARYSPQ
jgi:CRP-like cAMP-binding protein